MSFGVLLNQVESLEIAPADKIRKPSLLQVLADDVVTVFFLEFPVDVLFEAVRAVVGVFAFGAGACFQRQGWFEAPDSCLGRLLGFFFLVNPFVGCTGGPAFLLLCRCWFLFLGCHGATLFSFARHDVFCCRGMGKVSCVQRNQSMDFSQAGLSRGDGSFSDFFLSAAEQEISAIVSGFPFGVSVDRQLFFFLISCFL